MLRKNTGDSPLGPSGVQKDGTPRPKVEQFFYDGATRFFVRVSARAQFSDGPAPIGVLQHAERIDGDFHVIKFVGGVGKFADGS